MQLSTEQNSNHEQLDTLSVAQLLKDINEEDQTVPNAVAKVLPQIETVVNNIVARMKAGGRLFYIGAGTSGRLGVVDASECPPTFGVPFDLVVGIIAGGDTAIRKAVENAEDSTTQAWLDLQAEGITSKDCVIGIAASGRTPYVIEGVKKAKLEGIYTACVCCNANSLVGAEVDDAIEVVVGPEFITGSTRMKAGTAQKFILNMISTTVMIQLGRVKGNKMVHMQLTNYKLVQRAIKMIQDEIPSLKHEQAHELLLKYGSVAEVLKIMK